MSPPLDPTRPASRSAPVTTGVAHPSTDTALPSVWEYTDYRRFLLDTYQRRKATHRWYSYGVLAQKAGFKARDFLLRVMRGERSLGAESAQKLAEALDLRKHEAEYFLRLVDYNQAKTDAEHEIAWNRLQHALRRSRNPSAPRLLTDLHREVLSRWHHLAIRSLLEMRPDTGDWAELGRRLRPSQTAAIVKRSVKLLTDAGLVAKGRDGLWRATETSLATPAEVANPALRRFYRDCLHLAERSLEDVSAEERNITGVTLGISERTYKVVVERLASLRQEVALLAESDTEADRVVQLQLSLFPLSHPATPRHLPEAAPARPSGEAKAD
jgi:uncharacterized protein (TIGR02147 family)